MKETVIKIAVWISGLYIGALILPKPLFVLFFFCMIFLPLWFMDENDSLAEKNERFGENKKP